MTDTTNKARHWLGMTPDWAGSTAVEGEGGLRDFLLEGGTIMAALLAEDARRSVGVAAANLAVQYVASQISVDYRPTADKLQALEAATDQFLKNIKREDDAEPLINWLQGRANLLVDLRDEVEAARREEREACAVIADAAAPTKHWQDYHSEAAAQRGVGQQNASEHIAAAIRARGAA